MIENNPSNVSAAFEMLLEEVEAEIDFGNSIGSKAFENRDYEKAKEALERSGVMTAFRDKVAALRKEWETMAAAADREEDEDTKSERRNLGRLRHGQRTPESKYYLPILEALSQMRGSGKTNDVLERVGKIMKPTLKDVDHDPLASSPDKPRWRNTAQWARNTMVERGLLKEDSAHGTWEITDKGRSALEDARQ